jgi:hypothetical protein
VQYSEFEAQVERLKGVYSSSSLNSERVKVWWDRFKGISSTRFEKAIAHVIGESTTQALPSVSKIAEALMLFPERFDGAVSMQELPPAHNCAACRDMGFGFVGDTVIKCTCAIGARVGPSELAHHQASYNKGKNLLKRGAQAILPGLPYNPNERGGHA